MDAKTDLTNFWLAWHHTCAIRLCTEANRQELVKVCALDDSLQDQIDDVIVKAAEVVKSTNAEFRKHLCAPHGKRRSEFETEAEGWRDGEANGSAFELMENRLYAKGTINGRAFKDYLFEEIANRPGGMNRNLYGYMQAIMFSMAKESFGENIFEPAKDEDGVDIPPKDISTDGRTLVRAQPTPVENLEAKEVVTFFAAYLEEHTRDWDDDKWIVLFCILNMLRVGGEKVRPFFNKGHDTINRYCNEMRTELLHSLREEFDDKAIGMALNGPVQTVLDDKMKQMPCFAELKNLVKENQRSTGK